MIIRQARPSTTCATSRGRSRSSASRWRSIASIAEVVESMQQPTPKPPASRCAPKLRPTAAYIEGDVFALGRVYRNLIINAIQATAPGGLVVVTTRRAAAKWCRSGCTDTGSRYPARPSRGHLRGLRHDQTPRARPRPGDLEEDRRAARWTIEVAERGWQGHDLPVIEFPRARTDHVGRRVRQRTDGHVRDREERGGDVPDTGQDDGVESTGQTYALRSSSRGRARRAALQLRRWCSGRATGSSWTTTHWRTSKRRSRGWCRRRCTAGRWRGEERGRLTPPKEQDRRSWQSPRPTCSAAARGRSPARPTSAAERCLSTASRYAP